MNFYYPIDFKDYELIDSGNGRRLERFGEYMLDRPDPQIIWEKGLGEKEWEKADAYYRRTEGDKGKWENKRGDIDKERYKPMRDIGQGGDIDQEIYKRSGEILGNRDTDKWVMGYDGIKFYAKLSPFKHTGVFPEQASQWLYIEDKCMQGLKETPCSMQGSHLLKAQPAQIHILNLFGYTGIASLFAAKAGAKVTHVDASYPAIGWFRENIELNNMQKLPIRWILDDAIKFCQREVKRGVKYDGVIMDPPVYGHGPKGERWSFNSDFPKLMEVIVKLLSPTPLFVIVNAYAVSMSAITLENTLRGHLGHLGGLFNHGELTLQEKSKGRLLSTGIWAGWEKLVTSD